MNQTVAARLPRNRIPLVALLTATIVSTVGNLFTTIAVPWFVLQTTGSPTKAGITGAVTALSFVASFFGGTLVDRIGFRRVAVGGDLASGIAVALVPLLYHTVGLSFWQLLALVFLRALCNTPGNTARHGLLPDLIALADARAERVNGIYQATLNGAGLVGTALAGLLIALIGTSNMLWLDGLSFLFSATVTFLAVPAALHSAPRRARDSYWRELAEGWHFLTGDRLLISMGILAALINFIGAALLGVILPVYARQVYGTSVALGMLFAGASGGMLIGSACYAAAAARLSRFRLFLIGIALLNTAFWLLSPLPPLLIAVPAVALRGVGIGLLAPGFQVISQARVPAAMRGRVFGTGDALATLATPLGALLAGYAVSRLGLQGALIGLGLFTLVPSLWAVSNRALRQMDRVGASR